MTPPRLAAAATALLLAACAPHPPPTPAPELVAQVASPPSVESAAPLATPLASASPAPVASASPALSDAGVRPDGEAVGEALSLQARLLVVDTIVGTGAEAKEGDHVTVHIVGTLRDGTVFDSSRARKKPMKFVAGSDAVVKGLSEGVVGMRVGGHRTLTVPPSLGYGRRGLGTKGPPSAPLVFDVELLATK